MSAALDLRMPLSEWIRRPSAFQTFGNLLKKSSSSDGSAATALPDEYLIPALQIACSIADQICQVREENNGQFPAPGSDWIENIEVITQHHQGPPLSSAADDGDARKNIRVEILPSLLSSTITADENTSGRAKNCEIYSLGIVFYELFSGGERPAGLERKHTEVDGPQPPDGLQGKKGNEELLESLDPIPFDQGDGTIDLEAFSGVDVNDFELFKSDDLQDEHNNNNTDDSVQRQPPRKKESTSNDYVICAVSVEPLKTRGLPGSVCDLIFNMLGIAEGNGRLWGEDVYRDMSDVRDDLQLMLDKPSIYLYDQDMGRFATTGLQSGGTLFGRKDELSTIIDYYRRSAISQCESIVISGKSGTGKSLLMAEVGKYVISNGGILLSGKFDQRQQGKPFSALASALDQFCDALVRDHTLDVVKQTLARQLNCVLGSDAYYLTKLIPKLATILGMQITCSYHDENCVNAQNRIQWLLCEFVQVISTSFGAPVTLFLDDLQWADPASIAAVNHLLSAVNVTSEDAHLFFLGCFRTGQTDGKVSCDDIISSIQVKLDCMDEEALNTMVSETLCLLPRLTRALSSALYHKTKGNPLFVTRLMVSLSKEGLLRPSLRRRRWEWDTEKILCQKLPDDVAKFLSDTIEALPDDVKSTLSTLSCFGASVSNTFVITLEKALDKPLLQGIDAAIAEGLLDKIDDHYRFSHDRIQEAAYNMINILDQARTHFSYGMALAPLGDEEDDFIFTAVTQLNLAGPEAVQEKSQNASVANLNLRAGKKAMEMSDFDAAYTYFDSGISFLRKKHWEEHYALSLELYDLAAQCALTNGDTVKLQILYEQVLKYGRTFEDKLNVMYFSTCALAFSSRLRESIEIGLGILSKLGIDLRGDTSSMEVCVRETKELLSNYTDDDILNTRRMTDPTMIIAMKFLNKMLPGMTQVMPKSVAHVMRQIIHLSLDHGLSPVSPVGFVHFGSYIAKFGDISGGYLYVKLARSLLDKVGSKTCAGSVIFTSTQVVAYVEPVQAALEHHHEGYTAAMASGDVLQAAANRILIITIYFFIGENLQSVQENIVNAIQFFGERKQMIFSIQVQYLQQSVLKLIGTDEGPKCTAEGQDILSSNNSVMTTYYFQKVFISFLFRSYDGTKENIGKYLTCIVNSWGNLFIFHAFQGFYIGLVSFWLARKSGSGSGSLEGQQWIERGKLSKMALKKWAESSSWNFENKWYLLEAEELFCSNNFVAAKAYYDKAIASAKDHKFVNEEALACELAAYFYLELGQKDKALELFLAAHEKYHEWGAFGKCTSLFEFVSATFTSFIGSGQTVTNSNVNIGQEMAASAAAPNMDGMFSLTNTTATVARETVAPVAAPNTDEGLLTSLDDLLQKRYASS